MHGRKCCVPNCNNSRNISGIKLHAFPQPDRNWVLFQMWRQIVGGDVLTMDADSVFRTRRVCSEHFDAGVKSCSKRLCPGAIPVLNVPGKNNECNEGKNEDNQKDEDCLIGSSNTEKSMKKTLRTSNTKKTVKNKPKTSNTKKSVNKIPTVKDNQQLGKGLGTETTKISHTKRKSGLIMRKSEKRNIYSLRKNNK